jgi:hypothetical protein
MRQPSWGGGQLHTAGLRTALPPWDPPLWRPVKSVTVRQLASHAAVCQSRGWGRGHPTFPLRTSVASLIGAGPGILSTVQRELADLGLTCYALLLLLDGWRSACCSPQNSVMFFSAAPKDGDRHVAVGAGGHTDGQ